MDGVELVDVPNRQIQVQLLRHATERPRGSRQLINLLERKAWPSVRMTQIEPVSPRWVVLVGAGRLVPRSVDQPQQASPELGASPRIDGVEDHLSQARHD